MCMQPLPAVRHSLIVLLIAYIAIYYIYMHSYEVILIYL